jgi:hypothetical protein
MNTAWLELTPEQRVHEVANAVPQLGLPDRAIEKDYWVSLILETVFTLPDSKDYIFRGGTSLSKGYGLIDRFSEDIDLTFDRSLLGGTSLDPIKIRKKASRYIKNVFYPQLQEKLASLASSVELVTARDDGTPIQDPYLVIKYEPLAELSPLPSSHYLKPEIKIEPGARAISFPTVVKEISPLLSLSGDKPFSTITISPQVTFLDKVFLIHTLILTFERIGQLPPQRQSRHLYDLYQLYYQPNAQTYIDAALTDIDYYHQWAEHRLKYFKALHIGDYDLAPSHLNLHLPLTMQRALARDYQAMSGAMFIDPDKTISFTDLLTTLVEIQDKINHLE